MSEQQVEKGPYLDFHVSSHADVVMREWQVSEALWRMARRMHRRYPNEAKALKRASEDTCFLLYQTLCEAQQTDLDRRKEDYKLALAREDEERKAKNENPSPATQVPEGSD